MFSFKMFSILVLVSLFSSFANAYLDMRLETVKSAFDTSLYENALDTAECEKQLSHIRSDLNLRFQFLDAGLRIPKFITQGNTLDMGNYHGCLGIHRTSHNSTVQGKYCMINIPAKQKISFLELPELLGFYKLSKGIFQNGTLSKEVNELNKSITNREFIHKMKISKEISVGMSDFLRLVTNHITSPIKFRMAVCIPKTCTVREGLKGLLNNATAESIQYEEEFCRLPSDKPWATADYVAIAVFSVIGTLTILSTIYDLHSQFILLGDPKSVNPLYTCFSVYTNARRLTTFRMDPNALECVDGVRALSMAWVIVFHVFNNLPPVFNVTDYHYWIMSLNSIWITSASLAVDTFFMISGMLLVYANAGKMTGPKLIGNLHLFYLNRILRIFPLLAASILMQASFFHWMSDGPLWQNMAFETDVCRNYWWLNMLFVNNFSKPYCFGVSWYLSADMQLHILSPILLYFVLSGSKRQAWVALVGGLFTIMTASTIYVFIKRLPAAPSLTGRTEANKAYMYDYYFHTVPRAPPFFVGMLFGYILHLHRQHKPMFSKITTLLLWFLIIAMCALSLYSPEPTKDANHNNQTMDSLTNAFARPVWALSVATLVVLCVSGYGGPLNWFLSMQLWKLISRISYAMYLFHSPMVLLITGRCVQPVYFNVFGTLCTFFSVFLISIIVGFIMTVVIELPFSTISNKLLGGGPVNWLLSLQIWKLTSRISYAMYIFHYPIMYAITGSYVQPVYFSVMGLIYMFFSQFVISFVVGFFLTLIIDSPFSTIFKQLLGGGPKKPQKEELPRSNDILQREDPKEQRMEANAVKSNGNLS